MTYRHFISITEGVLPQTDFDAICSLDPSGRIRRGFRLMVDSDQPEGGEIVRQFVSICEARGLRPKNVSHAGTYGHTADRGYGDEMCHAEILVLKRQRSTEAGVRPERDTQGRLVIPTNFGWSLGSVLPNRIVVSDKVRRLLEAAALIGLRFGEVVIQGQPVQACSLWEIQSPVTLPKMANVHQFVHLGLKEAEPFKGDYTKIIMLHDPPFNRGEVHYRRSDIRGVEPFDIANTYENFMEPHPGLVISQRFYQHCLANKIPLEADLVRIDPD